MSAKKGGRWCAAPNCSNNSHVNKELSFFRFPKDKVRAKEWVIACRREDLLKRQCQYLYDNCKICSVHFEHKMFLNFLKNRLKPEAVPTLFDINNPSKPKASKRKAPDVKLEMQMVAIPELPPSEMLHTTSFPASSPNTAGEMATASIQLQTHQTKLLLSAHSSSKEQLRSRIKKLQVINRMLTKTIEKLRNGNNKCALENIDVGQFKSLCSKFLSEDLARFIKMQIDLNITNE